MSLRPCAEGGAVDDRNSPPAFRGPSTDGRGRANGRSELPVTPASGRPLTSARRGPRSTPDGAATRPHRSAAPGSRAHRHRPGVAVLAAVLGTRLRVELPATDTLSLVGRVGIAAALAAAAQLARLRFRLGRGTVSVSWGEAAFILGFDLVPAGWLPAATFVGATAAWLLISAFDDDRPPIEIVHCAASLTLGVDRRGARSPARSPDPRRAVGAPLTPLLAWHCSPGCADLPARSPPGSP